MPDKPLNKPFQLYIKAEDREKIQEHYNWIVFYIDSKLPIPYNHVENFLSCLKDENQFLHETLFKDVPKRVEEAMKFLNVEPNYVYNWYRQYENNKRIKVSTETIIGEAILAYSYFKNDQERKGKEVDKNDTLRFFYNVFNEHFSKMLSRKIENKIFTLYRRRVYAGILTHVSGRRVCDKKDEKNKIFQKKCAEALRSQKTIFK